MSQDEYTVSRNGKSARMIIDHDSKTIYVHSDDVGPYLELASLIVDGAFSAAGATVLSNASIKMTSLPAADPHVAGALYKLASGAAGVNLDNLNVVVVSAGP